MFLGIFDNNGEVNCLKAELFTQEFSQRHGIDYEEIFTSVAHLSSICALFTFADLIKETIRNYVYQLGVVSAFLNGEFTYI